MAEDMSRTEQRPRLGRGLAALLGTANEEAVEFGGGARRMPIEFLRPNPSNPRKRFDDTELDELAASIKERGVIQPVVVRPIPRVADAYEIIAGERRWRAAQRAGRHDIPVIVVEAGDREALEIAIVENVQRADLNALEEAQGYRALIDEFSNSQEDIAKIVGKSRSYVANTLRLLKLSDTVKAYIHSGKLTAGHARMLIGEPNADALAEEIIARELNVREVEAMARERAQKNGGKKGKGRARVAAAKDADVLAFEKRVSDATGLVVSIDHRTDRGTLTIRYNDLEQLDDLVQRLVRGH
jgi:ParB family chromosome partitioning protein